jgi:hypothetical protein
MRFLATASLVLAATAACATEGSRACTATGEPPLVDFTVDPAFAPKVKDGTLEVCWGDTCRSGELGVLPELRENDRTKTGALDVPGGPVGEVRVTLRLNGPTGSTVVDDTVTVRTKPTYPNGRGCDPVGPRASLRVDSEGNVHPAQG